MNNQPATMSEKNEPCDTQLAINPSENETGGSYVSNAVIKI